MDQLRKEYEFYKEGFELQGIPFNDTFEDYVKWKAENEKRNSDNIERHKWLYSVNG